MRRHYRLDNNEIIPAVVGVSGEVRGTAISKKKLHPCTGTEGLYRPYGP